MWEVGPCVLDVVSAPLPLNTVGKVTEELVSLPQKSPFGKRI